MIWDVLHETMSRQAMSELQLERLQHQAARACAHVPLIRERYRAAGLTTDEIASLDDLRRLPFMTKADFADAYPFGLSAVPKRDLARVHASSGTTDKPKVVAYTRADLEIWRELCARNLAAAGVMPDDMVQVSMGYGLFTGGLGWHYGAEHLGAILVPASAGNTRRQIMILQDFGATVLCCTPSYAIYLAEQAETMGVDLRQSCLRIGIHGAEPWSEAMRDEIAERLGLDPIDTYGLSELMGPGVAGECDQHAGLHINEDHFLAEIIDPDTLEPLPYGDTGELVITALTKEALPVIRYRTGDITRLNPEPCACGRTLMRMDKVAGRTDDMIIVRGVNVYPTQIEAVLLPQKGLAPHYQIIVDRERGAMDRLEVHVEVSEGMFTDSVGALRGLQVQVERAMHDLLGIQADIRLVEPGTIPRSQGKSKRVLDRRDLYTQPNKALSP